MSRIPFPQQYRNVSQALCCFISLLLILSGCHSSSSSTTSAGSGATGTGTTVSFAMAANTMQKNIIQEGPHFNNASVVTAMNTHPWFTLPHLMDQAVAAEMGLSLIWDPENGSTPLTGDFAIENLYIGGGFTNVSNTNNCTNGTLTVSCLESLKNFMGQALDPAFANSNGASTTMFGRLQSTSMVLCAIGALTPASSIDTDGLPVAGTYTVAFPTDPANIIFQPIAAGGCNVSANHVGGSITINVTAANAGIYTKQIAIPAMGGMAWLKLDAANGTLDVLSVEDERISSGMYAVNRALTHVTGINTPGAGTTRFEYISLGSNVSGSNSCYSGGQWQCSYEFHRVYIDEAADRAYLVSNFGDPGASDGSSTAPTRYLQFTAVAKPSSLKACATGSTCSGDLALSFTADGQIEVNTNTVYPAAGNGFDGCVNLSDRSLGASATLTCSVTGTSVVAGASAMINTTRMLFVSDVVATLLNGTTPATTFSFTDGTNIFTSADTN